jgi:hypothetical protein
VQHSYGPGEGVEMPEALASGLGLLAPKAESKASKKAKK